MVSCLFSTLLGNTRHPSFKKKKLNANTLREKRECKSHNPNYPKYRVHYFTNVVTNYTISHKKRSFECRQKPIFSDHE